MKNWVSRVYIMWGIWVIKSKERISQYGEVFTAEREVQAMLNLVDDETHRIDSRLLEAALAMGIS